MKPHKCPCSAEEMNRRKHDKECDKDRNHNDSCSCRVLLSGIAEGDTVQVFTNNPEPVFGILENVVDGKILQVRNAAAGTLTNICCSKINYISRL
jgi:hypothetical protein